MAGGTAFREIRPGVGFKTDDFLKEKLGGLPCSMWLVSTNSLAIRYRLHTLCHGGKSQRSSCGITHEQSHGYVRVGTVRGGLGIRLRVVVPGLWRVDPHDPLHLSPCIRLPFSGPTQYILNEDTQLVMRAIGVSHTACKDEFRRNLRSHSWSVF